MKQAPKKSMEKEVASNRPGLIDRLAQRYGDRAPNRSDLFYSLPTELLVHLQSRELELNRMDEGLFNIERVTARLSHGAGSIGVWKGQPVRYRLLAPPPPMASMKDFILNSPIRDAPEWQPILNRLDDNLAEADNTLDALHENTLGYCGWLLVNPQFIEEHDGFFRERRDLINQFGLPPRGPLQKGIEPWFDSLKKADSNVVDYAEEYGRLLDRWELADLQAPYLPEPREIQSPVLLPHQANHLTRGGGKLIFFPNNTPIPDRDTLRTLIGSPSKADPSRAHLAEWHGIVHAKNRAKNAIRSYARLFRLQHFWMVLHKRWGDRLQGRKEKLRYAFAAWLMPNKDAIDPGVDTIRKDQTFIASRRGGPNWYRLPNALDFF